MNHNFADWKLTILLPESNEKEYIIYKDDYILHRKEYYSRRDQREENIEDTWAWTWEDIRLYLKEKGFEFFIRRFKFHDKPYHCEVSVNNKRDNNFDFWYGTYEEARREAIIYCLNLINNGE